MQLEQLAEHLNSLIGEQVVTKLIAGNSISLWFTVPSSAPTARGVWIEPPWRIESEAGIETSSYGFPDNLQEGETPSEYKDRFNKACSRSDALKGKRLSAISVDVFTGDLMLRFSDGRLLRTFATSAEWEDWHYEDIAAGKKYRVNGRTVRVEQSDA
jgi:hypothetical protein